MTAAAGVATATVFVWSGMVLAISFLETPLKFRAPEMTVPIGLGIGRLVFRALNSVEVVLAVVFSVAVLAERPHATVVFCGTVAVVTILIQLAAVRPRLARRTDQVLAGADVPRSRGHYAYVGLELIKVSSLLITGTLLVRQ